MTDRRLVERTGERSIRTSLNHHSLSHRSQAAISRCFRGLAVILALVATTVASASLAHAEPASSTPSPTPVGPGPTPSVAAPSASPSIPSPGPASPASPSPSAMSARTPPPPPPTSAPPTPAPPEGAAASEPAALTFSVGSTGGPVAGAFYQDLGSYVFQGRVTGLADGTMITISRRSGPTTFVPIARTAVTGGAYRTLVRVTDAGTQTFRASTVISGDPDREVGSVWVRLTVADSGVRLDRPVSKIDALQNPTISGSVFPVRAQVKINIEVWRNQTYQAVGNTVSDASGRFRMSLGYGNGILANYAVRLAYRAVNSNRWEHSANYPFTRTAVLNAKVTSTTAAEVAKTYRAGCPVGASKLRTITMNFLGRDKRMHRGVIIIRTDLTQEIIRGFGLALAHRYPVAKMNNPNVYGGNDPTQMSANNTSGFNCRKVVGNPYAQSPHSYGIALDVNTVQNPYRDSRGKWWPSNGKAYIDRSDKRWGMLYQDSDLTSSLRGDNFFWGGLWNPGRDYQHFQYTR